MNWYIISEYDRDCDFIHAEMNFTKISKDGGVNMYAVGDEFAFDFVEGNKDNYMGVDMEALTMNH